MECFCALPVAAVLSHDLGKERRVDCTVQRWSRRHWTIFLPKMKKEKNCVVVGGLPLLVRELMNDWVEA